MNLQRVKKLSPVILLVLACGILLSSFHYHKGGAIFDDCPVCRFQDGGIAASSVDLAATTMPAVTVNHAIIGEHEIIISSFNRPLNTLPNAPPQFS